MPGVQPTVNVYSSQVGVLGLGAASGIFAQTCCFPLDTVRRRMQLKGKMYDGTVHAFSTIFKKEGIGGFYKGMLPNAVKVTATTTSILTHTQLIHYSYLRLLLP